MFKKIVLGVGAVIVLLIGSLVAVVAMQPNSIRR